MTTDLILNSLPVVSVNSVFSVVNTSFLGCRTAIPGAFMISPRLLLATLAATGILIVAPAARATDYDFAGTFTQDNNTHSEFLTFSEVSNVTLFSSSFATGGFDPYVSLWSSSGHLIDQNDDSGTGGFAASNGVNYFVSDLDFYLFIPNLAPGTYQVILSQSGNVPVNTLLASGFTQAGHPHYTVDPLSTFPQAPNFNLPFGQGFTTGDWSMHANVEAVPLPAAVETGMALLGILGSAKLLRRQRQHL